MVVKGVVLVVSVADVVVALVVSVVDLVVKGAVVVVISIVVVVPVDVFIVAVVGVAVLVVVTLSAVVVTSAIVSSLVGVEEFSPAVESSKSSKTEFVLSPSASSCSPSSILRRSNWGASETKAVDFQRPVSLLLVFVAVTSTSMPSSSDSSSPKTCQQN